MALAGQCAPRTVVVFIPYLMPHAVSGHDPLQEV
jgi:hypothetical protein